MKNSRQLIYVVDWLPPDFGAVGQYALLFARGVVQDERPNVCLIGLTSGEPRIEHEPSKMGILEIRRLRARLYDRSSNSNRLLWAMRTNLQLVLEILRHPKGRGAEVIFTGSPPFMLFFAIFLKPLRRARLVYRITDFYPEVVIADRRSASPLLRALRHVTWFLRRRVDAFEVLGEDQRRLLIANGISPEHIHLKRDASPVTITGEEAPLPRPAAVADSPTLLYSGNFGVAHEADTVVDGLIRYHRRGRPIALWLNATGRNAELVERRLAAAGVPCARTQPVALKNLPHLLAAPDAHLITLRKEFSGIVLPSKVYGCIASKRPVIFVGPDTSDVHLLCRQANALSYERVEPGDVEGFEHALERIFNGQGMPALPS